MAARFTAAKLLADVATIAAGRRNDLPAPAVMARLLGGESHGDRVRCPGPGHSRRDRSLEIWINTDAPGGYLVHSFAGDDPMTCRDYVRQAIGLEPWQRREQSQCTVGAPVRSDATDRDAQRRRDVARALWGRSIPGRGTLAEVYLKARSIELHSWPATLRFLPANPPKHLWPTLIAAYALPHEPGPGMLTVNSADVVGVQLTYLRPDGGGKAPIEPQKRSIGRAHTLPIVLAPITDGLGLIIAEGIEDALSMHIATGLAAWAAGGAGRLPALAAAVPSYVESVTIVADDDAAGMKGAAELGNALGARGISTRVLLGVGGRDGKTGR